MKRPYIFLSFFFITCYACSGQTRSGENQIMVVYNFQPNSTLRYEMEKTSTDPGFPDSENVKFIRDVEIEISPAEDGHARCTWKYGPLKITGSAAEKIHPMTRAVQGIIEGLQLSLVTNGKNSMSKIVNWEACKNHLMRGIDSLKRNLPATPSRTRDELSEILEIMESRSQTPKTMLGTYCPELAIYFRIMGRTFKTGDVQQSVSGLSNPMGGANLPAEQRMKLEQLNDSVAIISIHKAVPQTYLSDNLPDFNMTIDFTYVFDHQKNRLNNLLMEKTIQNGSSRHDDQIRMTLK